MKMRNGFCIVLFFAVLSFGAPRETSGLTGSGTRPLSPHQGSGVDPDPHFSVYFDLLLAKQPGKAEFSFLNFHPLLFFEILPTPDLQFAFEVNAGNPRYFELDYQWTERFELRAGKIWIPFDDLNPHNLFGGRIGTSRMRLGSVYFLPDVWTDLGVGFKWNLADSAAVTSEAHLYVVNGFHKGGADPQLAGSDFPNFQDSSVLDKDNNSDKAIGGRLHFLFSRVLGLGFSAYTCRWNDETNPDDTWLRLNMLGADLSLRIRNTSIKLGVIGMHAQLSGERYYQRHGEYVELSQRLGEAWKFNLRGGSLDTDDRLTDENDVVIVGAGLSYKPSVVQLSLEHQVDVKTVPDKKGYTFTFFRIAVQM